MGIAETIGRLLSQRGVQATKVISLTPEHLQNAIEQIVREILQKLRTSADVSTTREILTIEPRLGAAAE